MLDYCREIIKFSFGTQYVVHVNGLVIVAYYYRGQLCNYMDNVHDDVTALAKRLKLPVRYYYSSFNGDSTEYVHYDYTRRGLC